MTPRANNNHYSFNSYHPHEGSWLLGEQVTPAAADADATDDEDNNGRNAIVIDVIGDDRHDVVKDEEEAEASIVVDAKADGDDYDACVPGVMHRLTIGAYFALWYALNIVYNILNKQVLNILPAPLTVGCFQFGVGALYVGSLWLLSIRELPQLSLLLLPTRNATAGGKVAAAASSSSSLYSIGVVHCVGQLCTMVSLGSASVAFTHIVKALEPFFSAIVSTVLLRKYMSLYVYATLLPVVGGVAYACWNESSFSYLAFWMAMASNLAFALRAVLSKMAMSSSSTATTTTINTAKDDSSTNITTMATLESSKYADNNSNDNDDVSLSPVNVFGLVTWLAFFFSIPVALVIEGWSFPTLWKSAVSAMSVSATESSSTTTISLWDVVWYSNASLSLIRNIILSGFFHYMNNEVMYLALDNVHPVSLAVGNTMKRALIMIASVIFFHTPMSLQAVLGSGIGIAGVLVYSLTIHHYEQEQKKKQQQQQHKNLSLLLLPGQEQATATEAPMSSSLSSLSLTKNATVIAIMEWTKQYSSDELIPTAQECK